MVGRPELAPRSTELVSRERVTAAARGGRDPVPAKRATPGMAERHTSGAPARTIGLCVVYLG